MRTLDCGCRQAQRIFIAILTFYMLCLVAGCADEALVGTAGDGHSGAAQGADTPNIKGLLYCKKPVWDFGDVEAGQTLEHEFHLTNPTDQKVQLRTVHTDCGCAIVRYYPKTVLPHESIAVPVNLTVETTPGPFRRHVAVLVSEPRIDRLDLFITGVALPSARLFTPTTRVDFGSVEQGDRRDHTIVLARHDSSDVTFVGLRSDTGALSLAAPAKACPAWPNAVEIPIIFDTESLAPGPFNTTLTLVTSRSGDGAAELEVSVRADVGSATGLVKSVFISRLPHGQSDTVCLLDGHTARSPILECKYLGDRAITVDLVKGRAWADSIRVSCVRKPKRYRLIRGQLEITVAWDRPLIKVPLTVLVTPE